MVTIQCPSCGRTNVKKTTKGNVTRGAAKVAGIGAGMATQAAAQALFGVERVQKSMVSDWVSSLPSVQHVCNDCYQLFNVRFDAEGNVKSITNDTKFTDSEIQAAKDRAVKEQDDLYETHKGKVTKHIIFAVLSALYAVCCYAYPLAIAVGAILCLIFIFVAVSKNDTAQKYKTEADKFRKMSLKEFRYKHM